jgi:hypothetical protein
MISFLVAEKGTYSEENLTMTKAISRHIRRES